MSSNTAAKDKEAKIAKLRKNLEVSKTKISIKANSTFVINKNSNEVYKQLQRPTMLTKTKWDSILTR